MVLHLFTRKAFIFKERHNIDKSFFREVFPYSSLRSAGDGCFRKVNAFSYFRFEYKIDNFCLCGMVAYKMLKLKVLIDLALLLKLILFRLMTNRIERITTQNFLEPKRKNLLSWKFPAVFKIIMKIWIMYQRVALCCIFWSYNKCGTNICFIHFR